MASASTYSGGRYRNWNSAGSGSSNSSKQQTQPQ